VPGVYFLAYLFFSVLIVANLICAMFLTVFNSTQERIAMMQAKTGASSEFDPIMADLEGQMMQAIVAEQRDEFIQQEMEDLLSQWQSQVASGHLNPASNEFKDTRQELISSVHRKMFGADNPTPNGQHDMLSPQELHVRRMQEAMFSDEMSCTPAFHVANATHADKAAAEPEHDSEHEPEGSRHGGQQDSQQHNEQGGQARHTANPSQNSRLYDQYVHLGSQSSQSHMCGQPHAHMGGRSFAQNQSQHYSTAAMPHGYSQSDYYGAGVQQVRSHDVAGMRYTQTRDAPYRQNHDGAREHGQYNHYPRYAAANPAHFVNTAGNRVDGYVRTVG